ncbi:MAG: bifunctional DNA-formamidopyrimidine glycosylase/DNA-(apurinic or apyrimidinic site) lyase [Acidobacteriaceae bacterium]
MPELPEVETIARGMDARVRGRTIASVWLGSKPETFRSAPREIADALTGSMIQRTRRVGKHIVVDLVREHGHRDATASNSSSRAAKKTTWRGQWLVHLGMTGRLLVAEPDAPIAPHTHAIVQLDDGREIRFVDPRRFGRLAVLNLSDRKEQGDGGNLPPAAGFIGPGREPLDISDEAFQALFRGRRTPIKSALLNQSLLHGVGNIYADESLFLAGIRPRRQAARLTGREMAQLRTSLQSVLREAIAAGGSSVSDYVGADGTPGFFQFRHNVYRRTGEPCVVCQTKIARIVLGGRSTHFCPKCQR